MDQTDPRTPPLSLLAIATIALGLAAPAAARGAPYSPASLALLDGAAEDRRGPQTGLDRLLALVRKRDRTLQGYRGRRPLPKDPSDPIGRRQKIPAQEKFDVARAVTLYFDAKIDKIPVDLRPRDADRARTLSHLIAYADFLDLRSTDIPPPTPSAALPKPIPDGADPDAIESTPNRAIERLLESSLQFLECDFTDWACLEKSPIVPPRVAFRQEVQPATGPRLGDPIRLKDVLTLPAEGGPDATRDPKVNFEIFFTLAWETIPKDPGHEILSDSLAEKLAARLRAFAQGGLRMAMYGIDDLDGSLANVAEAIRDLNAKIPDRVRAVFDQTRIEAPPTKTDRWIFSYLTPSAENGIDPARWMMAPSFIPAPAIGNPNLAPILGGALPGGPLHTKLEYSGTASLLSLLNRGIRDESQARGRFEWPSGPLMHNKFALMKTPSSRGGAGGAEKLERSVFTGTANFSRTCMGVERNGNMGLFLKVDAIAAEYEREFDEMFEYAPGMRAESDVITGADGVFPPNVPVGRFHQRKRPNTHRYFVLGDGTEVRLHFAPTDDGEHRSILPMLLSARPGDELRISMFGNAGYELVRAIQFAVAVGAKVTILLDKQQAGGAFSWAQAEAANLFETEIYGPVAGELHLFQNAYAGKNHQKTASLTRFVGLDPATGAKVMKPEVLIVGSQNWSSSGNDDNDENMLSFQNKGVTGLAWAERYNRFFDEHTVKESNRRPILNRKLEILRAEAASRVAR